MSNEKRHQGSNLSKDTRDVTPPKATGEEVVVSKIRPPDFDTDQEWHGFQLAVKRAFDAGALPESIKTFTDALIIACRGREVDLPPLYALAKFYVVGRRVGMEAEAMRALVFRKYPNARIEYVTPLEKRHEEATFRLVRPTPGAQEQVFTFTIEDACWAGLVTKLGDGSFKAIPKKPTWDCARPDMLMARATSKAVRIVFPECVMGCGYTPDELEDVASQAVRVTGDIDSKFSGSAPARAASPEALPPAVEGFVTVPPTAPVAEECENTKMKPLGKLELNEPDDAYTLKFTQDGAPEDDFDAMAKKAAAVPRGTTWSAMEAGAVVPKFGRYMGKRLDNIDKTALREYVKTQLYPQFNENGDGEVRELIQKIEKYLEG